MSALPKLFLIAAGLIIEHGIRSNRQPGTSRRASESLQGIMVDWQHRQKRRKPPEAGLPTPAVPPKGPLPKMGGAEAPLEFD